MTKFALLALTLSPLLVAQTANTLAQEPIITKVIHVRYVPAEAIRDLIGYSRIVASANNGLKALVLKGNASNVAAAEEAVKELDVPLSSESARDVEVSVFVIGAAAQANPDAHSPTELAPVIRQLRAVFPYGDYQVLDSMLIRTREGRLARTGGLLRNFPNAQVNFLNRYNIDCDLADPSAGKERLIRINRFAFSTGVPNSDLRVTLDTNLDLQDGQKVVAGKTNIDDGKSALFVVVSAKFVQ